MDQLQRWIVSGDRGHHLEVQIAGEGLRLVGVEAVGEPECQDVDLGVAKPEVADVRLDLDDVAHELVT